MKKIILASALFIIVISSCTKEGPQGPPGNANVVSNEFVVNSTDWTAGTSDYYVNITDADITSDIINNGAVLVYWVGTSNGSTFIEPLPFTDASGEEMTCFAINGTEQIQLYNYTGPPADALTFKIVTMSAAMLRIHPELRKPNLPFKAVAPYISSIKEVSTSKNN